jgi:hypothetical protein
MIEHDRIVAIDPGIRNLGIAEIQDGQLVRAALIRNPVKSGNDLAAVRAISRAARDWLGGKLFLTHLAIEVPRVYGAGHQKGDQSDLIALATVCGAVAESCSMSSTQVIRYFPQDWKGQVDADVMTARILSRLSLAETRAIEKCPASLLHNVIDAIGIGLKVVGRMEPIRVYPR